METSIAMQGIYGLLVEACGEATVGRLGLQTFNGVYVYVGSAQGSGGLTSRVARHQDVASGVRATRRWHVDYLLSISRRVDALMAETSHPDAECALARELSRRADRVADGFGASDCRCRSHLFQLQRWDAGALTRAFEALQLHPVRIG